MTVH